MNTVNELLPNESQTESSPSRPSSLTCVSSCSPVRLESTEDLRTWLQQVGPANPTVLQETEEAWMTSERDGLTSSTSSARLAPDGSWVKMCQGFVQPTLDGTLEPFSETWQKAGIMRDGEYFRQPKWERRISEIGSGLLPTPRAQERQQRNSRDNYVSLSLHVTKWPTPAARDWRSGKASHATLDRNSRPLSEVVVQRESARWPTPRTSGLNGGVGARAIIQDRLDAGDITQEEATKMATVKMWPTPSANKTTRSGEIVNGDGTPWDGVSKPHSATTGKPIQTALTDAVQRWPTPRGRDDRVVRIYPNSSDHGDLTQEVGKADPSAIGGLLNPTFVEWLMNFPKGWTSLEPIDPNDVSAWESDGPATWVEEWEGVSRLTNDKTNRVARLKALGNAQVPLCVAVAWKLLTEDWA